MSAITVALAGANLIVLVITVLPYFSWDYHLDSTSDGSAIALPDVPAVPQRKAHFTAIQESPLFHMARQRHSPLAADPATGQPSPPSYRLAGIIEIPGKSAIAVVSDMSDGTTRSLRLGDEVVSWVVHAIGLGRVEFRHGETRFELAKPEGSVVPGLSIVARHVDDPALPPDR